ncbi:MAG TPA: NUDIX domain-containing protein [Phycisphaerae bacterium]|nr:NUDIX domain-containing protein [Phycisphaerae bacterium]HRW53342.1 NUDIX domain-containing protein [Phycisphaerae bacterium]
MIELTTLAGHRRRSPPDQMNETAPDIREEFSAGGVLLRQAAGGPEALVIRVRKTGYEIPKGHIEPGESETEAAIRETREETNVLNDLTAIRPLDSIAYAFEHSGRTIRKQVTYFLLRSTSDEPITFGPRPSGTREIRWLNATDATACEFVNEALRRIVLAAIDAA